MSRRAIDTARRCLHRSFVSQPDKRGQIFRPNDRLPAAPSRFQQTVRYNRTTTIGRCPMTAKSFRRGIWRECNLNSIRGRITRAGARARVGQGKAAPVSKLVDTDSCKNCPCPANAPTCFPLSLQLRTFVVALAPLHIASWIYVAARVQHRDTCVRFSFHVISSRLVSSRDGRSALSVFFFFFFIAKFHPPLVKSG